MKSLLSLLCTKKPETELNEKEKNKNGNKLRKGQDEESDHKFHKFFQHQEK